ncbi:MAG: hypothetical protein DYG84_06230 [Candidatus Brocadia sp. AMX3]|nr:hypothetical protein [Candidatus Brocadia sp. AMX3]
MTTVYEIKNMRMPISEKNIRATALTEFWGTEYPDSFYLWEGAKRRLTLNEMERLEVETLPDLFAAPAEIMAAGEYCKQVYFKLLPKLAEKLNEISGLSLPATFWRTAFGYWLFRHICITYEKYAYLSNIDIDRTSIKLLDRDSFYVPYDHYDYVYCFCNDFGVQQLVSQYYYLFKKKEFPAVSRNFNLVFEKKNHDTSPDVSLYKIMGKYGKAFLRKALNTSVSLLKKFMSRVEPKIVLCGVCYTADVAVSLFSGSKGAIGPISPPLVSVGRPVNMKSRARLLSIESENNFEYFLVQTLYYCLPQLFLEQFRDYYDIFLKDIRSRKFTHLVSEYWISDICSSLYSAIAQHLGRTLICYEHGSGTVFEKTFLHWIERLVADRYITVGWKVNDQKVIQGGFICRDIKPYQFYPAKKNILYIARTNFPYLMEFNNYNVPNTKLIKAIKRVRDFHNFLPESLRDYYILRPRREEHFWNIEHTLEVDKKNIRIDTGNFSDSILDARIVVIDHLSTGVAEIFLRNVPCLLIQDEKHFPRSDEIYEIFDELKRCGVLHNSAQSAVSHLTNINEDVQQWWNSEAVYAAISKLISTTLAPPSKTIDYLLSCLKEDAV